MSKLAHCAICTLCYYFAIEASPPHTFIRYPLVTRGWTINNNLIAWSFHTRRRKRRGGRRRWSRRGEVRINRVDLRMRSVIFNNGTLSALKSLLPCISLSNQICNLNFNILKVRIWCKYNIYTVHASKFINIKYKYQLYQYHSVETK